MEFRDYATTEAAGLIGRLLASRSEHARREWEVFRQALDQAAQAAETAFGASNPAEAEADGEITTLVERLTALATDMVETATSRITKEAEASNDALRKELSEHTRRGEQLAGTLKDARTQVDTLETELRNQKRGTESVRAELTKAQAARQQAEDAAKEHTRAKSTVDRELQEVRGSLEALRSESASVNRQLETEAAERAKLAAAFGAAQDQLHAAEAQRQTISALLTDASARTKSVEDESAAHERGRQELQSKLDAGLATEAALRKKVTEAERAMALGKAETEAANQSAGRAAVALEKANATAETLKEEQGKRNEQAKTSTASREQVTRAVSLPLDRLLAAFQKLATTDSLPALLKAIVDALAGDFSRVALFNVSGSRLEGQQQIGFTFKQDISKIVIPLGTDSLLARAVTSCRIQGASAGELSDTSRTLLGGKPGFVLVMPIAIRRKALAVIYADDSGQPPNEFATPERKAKFAQLLLWQAIPRLPKLLNPGKTPLAEAG